MFEQRSKDGKILYVVSYSYQSHEYIANKYVDGDCMAIFRNHCIEDILEIVRKQIDFHNANNPTTQRYHKLASDDIYDNVTETIINYNALMGLLSGLERDDKYTIADAIADLTE